jgi:hypothetical protein
MFACNITKIADSNIINNVEMIKNNHSIKRVLFEPLVTNSKDVTMTHIKINNIHNTLQKL